MYTASDILDSEGYGGPKSQDHLRVKIRQNPAIQEMTRYLLVYTCAGV